jgi:hypothetical protein
LVALPGKNEKSPNNVNQILQTECLCKNSGFDLPKSVRPGSSGRASERGLNKTLIVCLLSAFVFILFSSAIISLVLFIGLRWDGLTVKLLWIAFAVLLFIRGIVYKRSWPRRASILLIGVTLVKLVIFDSDNLSVIQKIISFLVIGVLLLLFSFYHQTYNLLNKKVDNK